MFAILGSLEGVDFLDLFAGSGIVALEALSRGARTAWLVDNDPCKRRILHQNLQIAREAWAQAHPASRDWGEESAPLRADTSVPPNQRIKILIRPVERFLKTPQLPAFSVVHLDPPFPMPRKTQLLERASAAGLPAPGGTLMIHYPKEDTLPEQTGALRRYDLRHYGRSRLAFYTRD